MSRTRRAWYLAAALVALAAWSLSSPTPAHSQGNLEVGPFRILPVLELGGEYNDNILLAPRDAKSDFIWTISPGITVELPGRRSALRLGYRADILRYTDHSDLDTIEHTVQGEGQISFPGGLTLKASDEYRHTQNFPGFPVPELTTIVDRDENTFRAAAEYGFAQRFAVGVNYNFYWVSYDKGDANFDTLDRQDHTIGGTLFYKLQPKTSLLAEYDYQMIRYDQADVARDRDSDAQFIKVGVQGDLTTKTTATVKVGYEFKDYDNPAREDFDGLVVEGEVIWKYRDPSQLRLYGGRANIESTFQGNNFYVANYGGLELRHYVSPRLILSARGLVGTNDYPTVTTVGTETKKRSDTFYEAGAGIRYIIFRWLSVKLDYQYLVRDSNFSDFDYTNNRVTVTVRMTY